jgi:predicted signal transduction protein with EAL and GGDEF domain
MAWRFQLTIWHSSSLSYLNRLPIDELKNDRSFVHDIGGDVHSGATAESIVLLGRALGLSVIAEGVESETQRDHLASLGCSSYQVGCSVGHFRSETFKHRADPFLLRERCRNRSPEKHRTLGDVFPGFGQRSMVAS